MTITDFLLARIAEDEASSARRIKPEYRDRVSVRFVGGDRQVILDRREVDDPAVWIAVTEPVAPSARVLGRVRGKRRIVELHRAEPISRTACTTTPHRCVECGYTLDGLATAHPCPTLRVLASVYADHPDFREEWRL